MKDLIPRLLTFLLGCVLVAGGAYVPLAIAQATTDEKVETLEERVKDLVEAQKEQTAQSGQVTDALKALVEQLKEKDVE